jgi:cell division protein FtsL
MLISDTLRLNLVRRERARERVIMAMKLAGIILIILCAFGLVARVDMEAALVDPQNSTFNIQHSTLDGEYHRLAVDISGCTPRGMHLNTIVEVVIEASSDLGWTAIGCTRFAAARPRPLPTKLILTRISYPELRAGE